VNGLKVAISTCRDEVFGQQFLHILKNYFLPASPSQVVDETSETFSKQQKFYEIIV
jgi:hypothetical protein